MVPTWRLFASTGTTPLAAAEPVEQAKVASAGSVWPPSTRLQDVVAALAGLEEYSKDSVGHEPPPAESLGALTVQEWTSLPADQQLLLSPWLHDVLSGTVRKPKVANVGSVWPPSAILKDVVAALASMQRYGKDKISHEPPPAESLGSLTVQRWINLPARQQRMLSPWLHDVLSSPVSIAEVNVALRSWAYRTPPAAEETLALFNRLRYGSFGANVRPDIVSVNVVMSALCESRPPRVGEAAALLREVQSGSFGPDVKLVTDTYNDLLQGYGSQKPPDLEAAEALFLSMGKGGMPAPDNDTLRPMLDMYSAAAQPSAAWFDHLLATGVPADLQSPTFGYLLKVCGPIRPADCLSLLSRVEAGEFKDCKVEAATLKALIAVLTKAKPPMLEAAVKLSDKLAGLSRAGRVKGRFPE